MQFNRGKVMPFIYFSLVFIFGVLFKTNNDKNEEANKLAIFILLGASLGLMARDIPMAQRFGLVVMPFYLLYVPAITKLVENKKIKIIIYVGLLSLSAIYYFLLLKSNNGGVLPYTSIIF